MEKKSKFMLVATMLICIALAAACKEDKELKEKNQELALNQKHQSSTKCGDKEALIELGQYVFKVPRKNGVHINFTNATPHYSDNNSAEKSQLTSKCPNVFSENITGVRMARDVTPELIGQLSFNLITNPDVIERYDNTQEQIAKLGMTKILLENQIEYYKSDGHLMFFILPKDIVKTANQMPVVLQCSEILHHQIECNTRYTPLSGINIFYKFKVQRDISENSGKLLLIENTARDFVLGMMEDTQEKIDQDR